MQVTSLTQVWKEYLFARLFFELFSRLSLVYSDADDAFLGWRASEIKIFFFMVFR